MKFKYKNQLLGGAGTAVLLWLMLMAADFIDEVILNLDSSLGVIVFLATPFAMLVYYIIHYIKHKPQVSGLLVWFIGYYVCFLPLWMYFYTAVNNRSFFIIQKDRSDFFSLNGVEYIFYGFSVLIFFTAAVLVFHSVMGIIKCIKKQKSKA